MSLPVLLPERENKINEENVPTRGRERGGVVGVRVGVGRSGEAVEREVEKERICAGDTKRTKGLRVRLRCLWQESVCKISRGDMHHQETRKSQIEQVSGPLPDLIRCLWLIRLWGLANTSPNRVIPSIIISF